MARGAPRIIVLAVLLGAALASPALGDGGHSHDHGRNGLMWGNMNEYPALETAGEHNVAKASSLHRRMLANAPRFATPAAARRAGYEFSGGRPKFRPGFNHMRKRWTRFWGRLLNPKAPQALVVWCPAVGQCKTAAFMFRAKPGRAPSAWGDILQWHRHGKGHTHTWMTHVWLVPTLEGAFASCAPMPDLVRSLGIADVPFETGAHVRRCTGLPAGGHPGHDH